MPQTVPAIVGYRQDRIGARVIAMLNVQRFAALTGRAGCYFWLSQPDGPYPELADPTRFFSAGYVARHMQVVDRVPDLSQRGFYPAVSRELNLGGLRAALAKGRLFWTDSNLAVDRVMDEDPAAVASQMAQLSAAIELAPRLRDALDGARAELARRWGPGRPFAIHVRRGDILDAIPWSLSSWPSKYLPDEFFRAFVAEVDGPVIAFSDTPKAITHLARGDARIMAVGDLVDFSALDTAERDLIEMLLMAGCRLIGAPAQSAFSRAAEVLGMAEIAALPTALPEAPRLAAFDALLGRVMAGADSFFAPGDLAQSLQYAAGHAVLAGQVPALLDAFEGRHALMARFPFIYRALAVAAQTAGLTDRAVGLATDGLAQADLRRRDRAECEQVLTLAQTVKAAQVGAQVGAGTAPPTPPATDADFLHQIFRGRAQDSAVLPQLGWQMMQGGGQAAQALLLPPALIDVMSEPAEGTQPNILPVWVLLTDWEELLDNDAHRGALRGSPDLWGKIRPLGPGAAALEQAIFEGRAPKDTPDADMLCRMGFLASVLRLNGRYRRAYAVLHWLEKVAPLQDMALTAKRLADCAFRSGNAALGKDFMQRAMAASPDNVLLCLSVATRAAQADEMFRMRRHLARAAELLPDSAFVNRKSRQIRRLLPPAQK